MSVLSKFNDFLEDFKRLGLEYFGRYHGPYRARVVNSRDPEGRGRVVVDCPRAKLPGVNGMWVLPMMDGAGEGQGKFWPPQQGSYVWVFFDNGDPLAPATYLGGWYGLDEVDEDFLPDDDGTPNKRGWMTPSGHKIILDDSSGSEKITIKHKDGAIVRWTEDGKVMVGVEGGSFEPMMRGSTVKKWLESHTHPHSWGPTGAPIQPFPAKGLSEDTETS